jgi:hypothetical protein
MPLDVRKSWADLDKSVVASGIRMHPVQESIEEALNHWKDPPSPLSHAARKKDRRRHARL